MTTRDYTVDELEAFYRLFGLEPGASYDKVKQEYRFQSQAVHPDKFSQGSSAQKWAQNRFVMLTEAKEALEKFLKDNPTGEPQGGWPGKKQPTKAAQVDYAESKDEPFVNWKDWKSSSSGSASQPQSEATKQVLEEWKQEQEEKHQALKKNFSRSERKKFVFWAKVITPVVLFMLYSGSCTAGHYAEFVSGFDDRQKHALVSKYNNGRISEQEFRAEVKRFNDADMKKSFELWVSGITICLLWAAYLYAVIAPRPRTWAENWIEGGESAEDD